LIKQYSRKLEEGMSPNRMRKIMLDCIKVIDEENKKLRKERKLLRRKLGEG